MNRLHAMALDAIWDSEERAKVEAQLEWPETRAEHDIDEADRQARAAMEALGVHVTFPFMNDDAGGGEQP